MTFPGFLGTVLGTVGILAVIGGVIGERPFTPAADDPPQLTARTLRIAGDTHGQFLAGCRINNIAMRCGVDTGATETTTLDREVARRVGIDVAQLRFTGNVQTANGVVRAAKIRVATLRVGPFIRSDVPVTVIDGDMGGQPQLGMAFLRQYKVVMADNLLVISE